MVSLETKHGEAKNRRHKGGSHAGPPFFTAKFGMQWRLGLKSSRRFFRLLVIHVESDSMDEAQKRIDRGVNFAAIAEVIDLDGRGELVSIVRDLSPSGCFVKTTTPFAAGTWVRIRITHSGAEFAAIGNVTDNVSQTGMGIIFTQMEPKDRAILERWLAG